MWYGPELITVKQIEIIYVLFIIFIKFIVVMFES
jgi:hypothetical protein